MFTTKGDSDTGDSHRFEAGEVVKPGTGRRECDRIGRRRRRKPTDTPTNTLSTFYLLSRPRPDQMCPQAILGYF
jgi:hypothetical protein